MLCAATGTGGPVVYSLRHGAESAAFEVGALFEAVCQLLGSGTEDASHVALHSRR